VSLCEAPKPPMQEFHAIAVPRTGVPASSQQTREGVYRVGLHRLRHVRIDVERHVHVGVSESLLHDPRILPGTDQECRLRVAEPFQRESREGVRTEIGAGGGDLSGDNDPATALDPLLTFHRDRAERDGTHDPDRPANSSRTDGRDFTESSLRER